MDIIVVSLAATPFLHWFDQLDRKMKQLVEAPVDEGFAGRHTPFQLPSRGGYFSTPTSSQDNCLSSNIPDG